MSGQITTEDDLLYPCFKFYFHFLRKIVRKKKEITN